MASAVTTHQLGLLKRTQALSRLDPFVPNSADRADLLMLSSVGLLELTDTTNFVLTTSGADYLHRAKEEGQ